MTTFGTRNSYSKTDTDATFVRVKEDHMMNGQLKLAYNLQIATCNQFVLGYDIFQNPTDTRTLIPFLEKMKLVETENHHFIVVDAGYGSESNYTYLENELNQHTAVIPYATMLREQSKKWCCDERKVMNWSYDEIADEYTDSKGVRFSFYTYREKRDSAGFIRYVKEYKANTKNERFEDIKEAYTTKQNIRRIQVNPSWEYFKAKQRQQLLTEETAQVCKRRKIDVETVFGYVKASLGFTRYTVRGTEKVKRQTGLLIMAINMMKLAKLECKI